jgi:hypothetical protein
MESPRDLRMVELDDSRREVNFPEQADQSARENNPMM